MSSGFVSEAELEEKRRLRQEEWDRVRQPDEPEEVPEEVYDHRSLFDRLEEQKQKKQMEYEEAHKLKNMIKGLDDDEVDFLDLVDRKKIEAEQLKELEEKQELIEFRKNVEKLKEKTLTERIQNEIRTSKIPITNSGSNVRSQHKLLKGVVIKSKVSETQSNGDIKEQSSNRPSPTKIPRTINSSPLESDDSPPKKRKREDMDENETSALTCVAILPGLGNYMASSDSDSDSSISEGPESARPKFDLCGRRLELKAKEDKTQASH